MDQKYTAKYNWPVLNPISDTARGDVWEVFVTPNDGYGDGEL